MKPYQLTIIYEVVEFFQQQNGRDRKTIDNAFEVLRQFPHDNKNLPERGPSGREYFVYLKGKYAIKYWIDEWENEVKIIDIRLRDPE